MGGKGSGGRRGSGVPRESNPVLRGSDPSGVDAAVNSRVMRFGMALMGMEPPDWRDEASVRGRVMEFLGLCDELGIRPMVNGLAAALCMDRRVLWGLGTGHPKYDGWHQITPSCRDVVQKAYNFLQVSWETYLVEEKGNPVKWLFLGKNYFGYEDQTVRIQRREDDRRDLPDPDEVAAKYALRVGREAPALEAVVEDVVDAG